MNKYNDLTFFTNENGQTLLDRFNKILSNNTQFFDVLVGYFRTSGFYKMYKSIECVEKTRILIGINTDKKTVEMIKVAKEEQLNFMSNKEAKEKYSENIKKEFEDSEDTKEVENGIKTFIKLIKEEKLEIRVYPYNSIHAKVYIMRKDQEKSEYYGSVITGSSNFTENGLVNNIEFNVELKDSRDVQFALDKFEALWAQSVDVSEQYVETVNTDTWIRDDITPYELYLKLLYEYFQEEINQDKKELAELNLPDNFMKLQYQIDAVNRAKTIIDAYGGVFVSDVVGLGKTYICAMLAQQLKGKKLIICPPVLKDHWKEVLFQFDVSAKIESLGMLDSLIEEGIDDIRYVFVDEAHRFRNSNTDTFAKLHEICLGKKVILISATPQNNYISDLASQIYLFQEKKNSTIIPNQKNIEAFFNKLQNKLKKYDKDDPMYKKISKQNSQEIRDKVLRNVMVRRTRKEIVKWYENDLKAQGLSFPNLNTPKKIIYEFDEYTDDIFIKTIEIIKELTYSRYKPLTYLKNIPVSLKSLLVGQKNMGGFMKAILLKRLESSFYAFNKTLGRFISSYENFIKMYNDGIVYISKKYNVYDMMDNGDDDKLMGLVEEDKVQMFKSSEFTKEFIQELKFDLLKLKEIQNMWELVDKDPKLDYFIHGLKNNEILIDSKMIIFTESKETAEYLGENLNREFKDKVIVFTGQSSNRLKQEIEFNYNPDVKEKNQKDDYRILVTTDVLAEGISLHRANIIVNYDLPWNPTRIMQRVGRINRVGSKYQDIYVFNFFPTSQSSKYMSLEDNIISKIQAFHDTLGEDFKYLSDDEEVESHALFGKELYSKLNSDEILDEEGDELDRSELEYLQEIRTIRDENIDLFEKIKRLPKKVRSAKMSNTVSEDSTVTFFRKGALKKFFITSNSNSNELTLFQTIDYVKSSVDEEKKEIKDIYYEHLNINKEKFINSITEEETFDTVSGRKNKNDAVIIKILKGLRNQKKFTQYDYERVERLKEVWELGIIPSAISKDAAKGIKTIMNDPAKILNYLWDIVPDSYKNYEEKNKNHMNDKSEVILSSFLIKGE
ncbi:helicase-related protein [Haloimpatiens sp. FM7330]|uniref:helicase-related protein n=1 Tax=Haloimpatiens sp. FM7330 TaxID=3298610 RepID=UPI00363D66C5